MPSVDDFAKENPSLSKGEASAPPSADDLRLLVEIIEVLPEAVNFAYAGIGYSVARNRVSDISVIPRSLGDLPSPPYAILTISHNTQLTTIHSIAASDLVGAVPFSMAGHLEPKACSKGPSEREIDWISKTGYNLVPRSDVAFSSNSATRSGGANDDSGVDDWCHAI
ncbi:hypothetical protein MESS2_350072 [Mesorhizobium metallidurans STM 2683]|uniref:Uncharacterized protein n=1 Tax=Mesorhizobium metallidurans STM 2683 TaxID=1297569 RepID=M5ERJ3_9HYPH|nr:hypothetical protein [Mesorhizobium metallidurans]CCV06700.1 hypothetical protein MESS2_350072 [Mesorhizobium metallidurans STM 2683]